MISIETKEGVIEVISPYNPEFVDFSHMRGGKWSDEKQVWMFDKRDEFAVRSALIDIYGTDNYKSCEKVDIRAPFKLTYQHKYKAFLCGRWVVKKKWDNVKLADNVVLVDGGLSATRKNIRNEKAILEIRCVPEKAAQSLYKENPEDVEIIGGINEQKLKDEKKQFQERIEEIDELLETLKEDDSQEDGIIADLQD